MSGKSPDILSNANNLAETLHNTTYPSIDISVIYNDILDGMLPGVLALNKTDNDNPNLDIRLMLSKVLTFNTLLWNNNRFLPPGPNNYQYHWGWNEIPVNNDNALWKNNNASSLGVMYNLLIYIPLWNQILLSPGPWSRKGENEIFWDRLLGGGATLNGQLDQYIDKLKDATIINFVFATDEYVDSPLNLETILTRDAYAMTGFTSLGSSAAPGPPDTITTRNGNKFVYQPQVPTSPSPDDPFISDSFLWRKTTN